MVPVELCITRSGFYVADTVPDLRAIESHTEVAASQINRRGGAAEIRREGRRERRKKERERERERERNTQRRDERKRGTEEDDATSAGAEDAFHSAESERRAR
ncbi:hypothetical protein ALC62_07864 [Cyphomyrmex costatus]|uniref:Uncharacterized protein n=1 Tax=Cyphomyrmex costatus TaxID=456900 RepID=A0A195CKI8_9HYME|nr:hypothetical protein ALC62_07864 [Cyphomyrmex costatus]